MRRGLFLLFTFLCCAVPSVQKWKRQEQTFMDEQDSSEQGVASSSGSRIPEPFRSGNEYVYIYNSQIASGLVAPDISAEPDIPQQKAVTRMQALAYIQFHSNRYATLRLQKFKVRIIRFQNRLCVSNRANVYSLGN